MLIHFQYDYICEITEKRKMGDLQKLKSLGGPLTTPDEVDVLVNDDDLSDEQKQDRLYIEVRYARDTTLSLPKVSPIFRLKNKYKKLFFEQTCTSEFLGCNYYINITSNQH